MKDARGGAGGGPASRRKNKAEYDTVDMQEEEEEEEAEDNDNEETSRIGVPDGWEPLPGDAGDGIPWRLPSLEEVSEELVERRRRRLLETLG